MTELKDILARISYLEPFSTAATRALDLMKSPLVSPDELAEIIKFDQTLTANILKVCNSSYYGCSRKVSNIKQAIILLGSTELRRIILMSGTRGYYKKKRPGYENQSGELWLHTIAVAALGEILGERFEEEKRDKIFITALLHDIGKVIVSDFLKDKAETVRELVENNGMSFIDAEREVVGHDHAEVGGLVLDQWHFPDDIVRTVRLHHQPPSDNDTDSDLVVKVADSLALMMGYGTSIDGLAYPGFATGCSRLGLSQTDIEHTMAVALEAVKRIEADSGISVEE